jgi:hypothetical protein
MLELRHLATLWASQLEGSREHGRIMEKIFQKLGIRKSATVEVKKRNDIVVETTTGVL